MIDPDPFVKDAAGTLVVAGDVVQIDPDLDPRFGACFLVVSEVKPWGVQGYVSVPEAGRAARAYYRVKSASMVRVGLAAWAIATGDDRE